MSKRNKHRHRWNARGKCVQCFCTQCESSWHRYPTHPFNRSESRCKARGYKYVDEAGTVHWYCDTHNPVHRSQREVGAQKKIVQELIKQTANLLTVDKS